MVNLEDVNVEGCRGNGNFDFDGVGSHGRSGGLVSIWDNSLLHCFETIKSHYFLITIGNWRGLRDKIAKANIYGP